MGWIKRLMLIGILLIVSGQAAAQEDAPANSPLPMGQEGTGTITQIAPFDWWQIEMEQGAFVRITMSASEGLAPMIGVLNANRDLLIRSDEGVVNGAVQVMFEAPASGSYIVVATRVGVDEGTTTGAYSVRADIITEADTGNAYAEVTFRCNDYEATTLAVMEFSQEADTALYDVILFGTGDLQPVFKIETTLEGDLEPCWDQNRAVDYTLTFPDGAVFTQADSRYTRLAIDTTTNFGRIRLTFGSRDGAAGRFAVFVNGLQVEPADSTDVIEIRNGPRAAGQHPLDVYMVREQPTSRLDPFITEQSTAIQCDDAGRRGCESIPALSGAGVTLPDFTLAGGRFDAGMRIEVGDLTIKPLVFGSRSGRTSGGYSLLFVGELPPLE